jgi:hypothetical protein
VALLSFFFGLGALPAAFTALALARPGAWSEFVWRLKPSAPAEFIRLGSLAIPLMIGVAAACGSAAFGLWKRRRWGRRLAILILGVNLLGDSLNAVLRGDWRTLIGLPIGGAMLVYLFTPGVRGWFRGP